MSRALRSAALIAGSVALISTGIGAAIGAKGVLLGVTGATFAKVGAIAGVVSGVASAGSQILQPKIPPRGSPATILIELQEHCHDAAKWIADTGRGLSLVRNWPLHVGGKAAGGPQQQVFRERQLALGHYP